MNIAKNLENAARFFPGNTALLDAEGALTYGELDELSDRAAGALVRLGMVPGDFVCVHLPNGRRWMIAYFGAIKAGCVAVPLAAGLTRDELIMVLSDCRPRVLFTEGPGPGPADDPTRPDRPEFVISPAGDLTFDDFLNMNASANPAGCRGVSEQFKKNDLVPYMSKIPRGLPRGIFNLGGGRFPIIDRDRDDLAAVLYTGGTTGRPKGVMLSHENILASAHNVARQERSTEKDRSLCFLPLNHVFGQMHIMHSTVLTAGSLVFQPGFDLNRVLDALEHLGVTKFYAVPTVYMRLLGLDDLRRRLGSVRYCFSAAASMALELVRAWKKAAGLDIYEAYGLTETASMVTYNHYHRHRVGSVGAPVGTVETAILDDHGLPVPPGREGEICVRGPNVMKGYLNRPEETRTAFWGPWLRTGDVGRLDDEGYLYIVDRLKDMIITGGENVYPREVEELLYEIPGVAECAVVGLPDAEYGERVTAVLREKPGTTLDPKAIRAYLKERLSGFKVPKEIRIQGDDLPKSGAGKILKREIRAQLLSDDQG